jgi:hypothetical protein
MNEQQRMLQEKFRQMGVPSAGMVGGSPQGQVTAAPQNMNKLHLLNQIKRGGKRGEFDKFIKAKTANDKFEPIPEPKMRKNPNDKVDPKYAVKPETFGAKSNPELNMIEKMFDGGGGMHIPQDLGYNQMQQRPMTTDLSLDNISLPSMPDPSMYLAQKNSEAYQQQMLNANPQPQMNPNNPYAQYTLQGHGQQPVMDMGAGGMPAEMQSDMSAQQQYAQQANMKAMMEQIAQSMAERTIKQFLNEYAQGKNLYETTNYKTKDGHKVIKTADGRYYKLTPVRINKVD